MNEKIVLNPGDPTKKNNGLLPKIVTSFLGFLLIAIYLLADRYLIEHVEMEVAVESGPAAKIEFTPSTESNAEESEEAAFAAAVIRSTATDISDSTANENSASAKTDEPNFAAIEDSNSTTAADTNSDKLPTEISQITKTNTMTPSATEASYTADEVSGSWTYQDDSASITIQRFTRGSGNNTVTYFAADVVLSEASALQSAFAKNKFGTNIIEKVTAIAADNNAVFAINGDYYGFRSDGIIIRNGAIYRNKPARVGLAIFDDGTMQIYDERTTDAETLVSLGVVNTLSFGPALIQNGVVETDFENTMIDTNFGNRTIDDANPRTGIGLISENHFVFIVADGRSKGYSRGLTLNEFAEIFADLGCTEAYNIDGGGSSAMYFMGKLVNNPLGRQKERGTSDILFIAGENKIMEQLAKVHE